MKHVNAQITINGSILEGHNFWDGFQVNRTPPGADWLHNATVVILSAFVEHQPRRLLEAIARGVPVIASKACGLRHVGGVVEVECGDTEVLRHEIERVVIGIED